MGPINGSKYWTQADLGHRKANQGQWSHAMAQNVLRDIGNRNEAVVMQQAVPAKPTASQHRSSDKTEGLGATRKKKKSSRAKRQPGVRRAAYKYRCPCLKCVGRGVAISYQSTREHIKDARGRISRNFRNQRNTEAFMDSLMKERRRMDDFEANLFKYIAAEEGGLGKNKCKQFQLKFRTKNM